MRIDLGLEEGPSGARALLRGLAAEDAGALADWLAAGEFTHDHRDWLDRQGLSPFAFYRLKQVGLLSQLPVAEQVTLREAFIRTTASDLLALGEERAWACRGLAGFVHCDTLLGAWATIEDVQTRSDLNARADK